MAFAFVASRGTNQEKTSDNSLSMSPSANLGVGVVAVVACVSDNASAADGETNEHSVADSQGNTWTKLREQCESGGAANAGITVSTWVSLITTQISTTDTITLTLSDDRTSKAMGCAEFSVGAGSTISLEGENGASLGASTTPSVTSAGTLSSIERLWLGTGGREGGGSGGGGIGTDGDYADAFQVGTSGGSGSTNVDLKLMYRIATLTADTLNCTSPGGEIALTIGAVEETAASGGATASPGLGEATWTGFAPTVTATNHQTVTPGVGAATWSGLAPTVTASDHQTVTPGLGSATWAGFAPTVTVSADQTVTPGVGQGTWTGFAPTVTATAHQTVTPGPGAATWTGFAPDVIAGATVFPVLGQATWTGFAPTVTATANQTVEPGPGEGTWEGFAPTVTGGGVVEAEPEVSGGGPRPRRFVFDPKPKTELKRKARRIPQIRGSTTFTVPAPRLTVTIAVRPVPSFGGSVTLTAPVVRITTTPKGVKYVDELLRDDMDTLLALLTEDDD